MCCGGTPHNISHERNTLAPAGETTYDTASVYAYHSQLISRKSYYTDELIRSNLTVNTIEDEMDTIMNILTTYDLPEDGSKLSQTKVALTKKDYVAATNLINEMRVMGGYDSYCDYMELLLQILQNNISSDTVSQDELMLQLLQATADDKDSPESAGADAYLSRLQGVEYQEWIEPNNDSSNKSLVHHTSSKTNEVSIHSLTASPNPASDETTIKIVVPSDLNNGKLFITDIAGRNIVTIDVTENTEYRLNTTEYAKGIYLCTFKSNNLVIDKVKLTIIK